MAREKLLQRKGNEWLNDKEVEGQEVQVRQANRFVFISLSLSALKGTQKLSSM